MKTVFHDDGFMNLLQNFAGNLAVKTEKKFNEIGDDVIKDMKSYLTAGDHVDTGNLINSMKQKTEREDMRVKTQVTIDAMSKNDKWYAQFIEHGTGIYNDEGAGRTDGWYYVYSGNKFTPYEQQWIADHPQEYHDQGGVLRFTYGQKADPFIEPSIDNAIEDMGVKLKELIYDTVRDTL